MHKIFRSLGILRSFILPPHLISLKICCERRASTPTLTHRPRRRARWRNCCPWGYTAKARFRSAGRRSFAECRRLSLCSLPPNARSRCITRSKISNKTANSSRDRRFSELSRYKSAYKHTRRRASLNALLTRSQLIRLRLWIKVRTWFEFAGEAV
jgi:hypothetical protein